MAKKLEIIGQALVITDTSIPKVIFESPKSEVYYDLGLLLNDGVIKINNIDALDNAVVSAPRILLSDSVDESDTSFTVSSFQSFARTNLGFKTASGGSGAVDSVNGQTGVVSLNADDISDSSTTKKFTTEAEASKLAGIENNATADQTDAEIETAYNNQVSIVSQADAEAGTSTTVQRWTPERVAQAIAALGGSGSVDNTAYGVSWNGVTGVAPSKNAVYDKIESLVVGAGVGATPLKAILAASAANHDFGITIPDSALLYYGATGGGGLVLLEEGVDYTKSGSIVTFLGTITPIQANDVLILNPNVSNESLREILGYGLSASNGVPVDGTAEVDRVVGPFTCTDIRISLRSADTTATVTVDVHKNGVSILDTLVTIDATEKTSVTATTPFVFTASASSISFADDDEIEFIISGTPTDATGLKVKLIGTRN